MWSWGGRFHAGRPQLSAKHLHAGTWYDEGRETSGNAGERIWHEQFSQVYSYSGPVPWTRWWWRLSSAFIVKYVNEQTVYLKTFNNSLDTVNGGGVDLVRKVGDEEWLGRSRRQSFTKFASENAEYKPKVGTNFWGESSPLSAVIYATDC